MSDWKIKLAKETAVYVHIDLANVFYWQNKLKGKRAYVVAIRGSIGHELKITADHYIAFGKLYTGVKRSA